MSNQENARRTETAETDVVRPTSVSFDTIRPAEWPAWLSDELARNTGNGRVGSLLVSSSDRVRVWHLIIQPGERIGFHRHVLDYFWTVTSGGKGRSHYGTGEVDEVQYEVGQTTHFSFRQGESMIHDLENIGNTIISFVTVEYLASANPPLPI